MAHQIKLLLGRAEKIAVAQIGEGRRADVLDNFHRNLRQAPAQVLVDRARLRTGLDDQLCGKKFFHISIPISCYSDLSLAGCPDNKPKISATEGAASASQSFPASVRNSAALVAENSTWSRPPSKPGGTVKRICGGSFNDCTPLRIFSSVAAKRGYLSRRSCSLTCLSRSARPRRGSVFNSSIFLAARMSPMPT